MVVFAGARAFAASFAFPFDDQAQKPIIDETLEVVEVSVCAKGCPGCGAGIELDAIGDGPSLGKADADVDPEAALTSLLALMGNAQRCRIVSDAHRLYSSCRRRLCCSLNSSPNVATPIATPEIVARAIGRSRPAILLGGPKIEQNVR